MPIPVLSQTVTSVWDYGKVISDINDGARAVSDVVEANLWADAVLDDQSRADPKTPFGGSLSNSLSRGLQKIRQIDCPRFSSAALAYNAPADATAASLQARRQYISSSTKKVIGAHAISSNLEDAKSRLESLAERARSAGDGARIIGDELAEVAGNVPQAFQNHAGYAALDFLNIYVPLLARIETAAKAKSVSCNQGASDVTKWLTQNRSSLEALLKAESSALLRISSGAGEIADEGTSTEVAAAILKLQREISTLTQKRTQIVTQENRLRAIADAANSRWDNYDATRIPVSDQDADNHLANIERLSQEAITSATALNNFVRTNKPVVMEINKQMAARKVQLDAMLKEAEEIGDAQALKEMAAQLLPQNNADQNVLRRLYLDDREEFEP